VEWDNMCGMGKFGWNVVIWRECVNVDEME